MMNDGAIGTIDSHELQQVAQSLAQIATKLSQGMAATPSLSDTFPANVIRRAELLYRARRQRAKHFDERLFGEPAWDLLLDLFIHGERGKRVSVSSACVGAAVPPTTALRWIDCLVRDGLVMRVTDPQDGRRIFLQLSIEGRRKMIEFLEREL